MADESGKKLWYLHVNSNTGERLRTQFGALDAYFRAVLTLSGDLTHAKNFKIIVSKCGPILA
jgi:hypothetical protein